MSRPPQYREYNVESRWTVVVRPLRWRRAGFTFGYLARIERGPLFRGPRGRGSWWWRPTFGGALSRGRRALLEVK